MNLHSTFLSATAFLSNLHFYLNCLKIKFEMKKKHSGTDDLLKYLLKYFILGTSLAVQRIRLQAPNAGGPGSIPGQANKLPHTMQPKIKIFYFNMKY